MRFWNKLLGIDESVESEAHPLADVFPDEPATLERPTMPEAVRYVPASWSEDFTKQHADHLLMIRANQERAEKLWSMPQETPEQKAAYADALKSLETEKEHIRSYMRVNRDPEELRARFAELQSLDNAIVAQSGPLRAERDRLVNELPASHPRLRELADEFRRIEAPLGPIRREMTHLVYSVGAAGPVADMRPLAVREAEGKA